MPCFLVQSATSRDTVKAVPIARTVATVVATAAALKISWSKPIPSPRSRSTGNRYDFMPMEDACSFGQMISVDKPQRRHPYFFFVASGGCPGQGAAEKLLQRWTCTGPALVQYNAEKRRNEIETRKKRRASPRAFSRGAYTQ